MRRSRREPWAPEGEFKRVHCDRDSPSLLPELPCLAGTNSSFTCPLPFSASPPICVPSTLSVRTVSQKCRCATLLFARLPSSSSCLTLSTQTKAQKGDRPPFCAQTKGCTQPSHFHINDCANVRCTPLLFVRSLPRLVCMLALRSAPTVLVSSHLRVNGRKGTMGTPSTPYFVHMVNRAHAEWGVTRAHG